ncbi:NAD(P)/FAD-dependent oxidoreductase [Lentibacillus sp. CBA3610]|uniref:NAD(P)/FAD-dependent oxidoreductase n=1 Tax=Lentibacillus sp. CBA3610 TaxID=2518176 RepID=UPI00159529C4|nr:NAD(P)/FAD-dependent oxidoreductase [Lentibacillus sp. CBA3610]QKY71472.1 NAD(P)/FAD-dependent oxidoreductase [Lentibacillus sp. CBA3610]
MTKGELFDVTIIGGGPAGLFSAFYSGLREMKTKIIEYQPHLGGKVHVYPEKMIWDIGGVPPISGAKYIDRAVEQGLTFNPDVVLNEKVASITRNESGIYELHGDSGIHYSKAVIVAVGSGILNPKKLDIAGAERFEESNLHYSVESLKHFKGKTVMISGGGSSATDWANELESIAERVFISCRKNNFDCHESLATRLKNSSVVCFFHTTITDLVAGESGDTIKEVELSNHETGAVNYLPVDNVIVNHGYERDTALLENSDLDIAIADNYFISGSANSESSLDGLYAAGDILMHEGKLNLIAGAFQDAANAVNQAKQFIQPDAEKAAMVSSHNDVFKKRNEELKKQMIE